ncbi:MAG: DUF4286 family protein [Phycisphaerales bacterium]|nr:DUF4286 family protein [Phycisphaerales bacterium]
MPPIFYRVIAHLPDSHSRSAYLAWLRDGHLNAVLAAGAVEARIILPDDESAFRVESQYIFESRACFDDYVREHAPTLRAEGLARFGHLPNLCFERTVGEIPIELTRHRPS